MRGIGLVPNWKKENSALVVERICDFFDQRGITVLTAGPGQTDYLSGSLEEKLAQWQGRVEMLLVVGGDGTILRAARDLASWEVPYWELMWATKAFSPRLKWSRWIATCNISLRDSMNFWSG